MGHVHLTVADLEAEVSFYQRLLGLRVHRRDQDSAALGAGGGDLLRLTERPGGRRARGTTGLYHFAIEMPSRRELARALARLFAARYPHAPTDHIITETTYLSDPEGNGIELTLVTPERGSMTLVDGDILVVDAQGRRRSAVEPLDVEGVLGALGPGDGADAPLPRGTRLSHMHLHVADIGAAMRFYRDVLGFEELMLLPRYRLGDVMVAGYRPHLIAFNTWAGEGAPPPPDGALGLLYFTVRLPDEAELARVAGRVRRAGLALEETGEALLVRDPSQNGVLFTAGA